MIKGVDRHSSSDIRHTFWIIAAAPAPTLISAQRNCIWPPENHLLISHLSCLCRCVLVCDRRQRQACADGGRGLVFVWRYAGGCVNIFMHVRGGLYVQMSVFWGVFAVNSRWNICGFQESYQSSAEWCCSLEKNHKKPTKTHALEHMEIPASVLCWILISNFNISNHTSKKHTAINSDVYWTTDVTSNSCNAIRNVIEPEVWKRKLRQCQVLLSLWDDDLYIPSG